MYCIHCGHSLPDEARFCSRCGDAVTNAPARGVFEEPNNHASELPELEMAPSDPVMVSTEIFPSHVSGLSGEKLQRLGLGDNVAYYGPQFAAAEYRFNWVALFFPMIWFAYRKLYVSAFVMLVVHTGMIALASHAAAGAEPESVMFLLMLAKPIVHFSAAVIANERLLARVNRVISAANETSLTQDESVALIKDKGGTSWIAPILFLLAFAAASSLILTILGMHTVASGRFR